MQVGGRRIGSVREIELTDDNQAKVTIEVEKDFAPLHEGTTALDPRDLAVGHRQPLHRAHARPQQRQEARRRRARSPPTRRPRRSTSTSSSTRSTRSTRKGLQQVVQGSPTQYEGREAQANAGGAVLQPGALDARARLVNELTRDQHALEALLRNGAKVTARSPRAATTLTDLVTNANTDRRGDRRRARRVRPRPRAAAGHAAPGQHDVRQPARDARRPRRARRRVQAGRDEARAVLPRAAPARARRAADDPRPPDADPQAGAGQRPHRPAEQDADARATRPRRRSPTRPRRCASSMPVLSFIRPYTPDLVGWFRDFGQGAANYDANGHYARIQPIFNAFSFTDNPAGGVLTPRPQRSNPFEGLTTGNFKRCPGAATQPPPDGSAPGATPTAPSTATRPWCSPGHEAPRRHRPRPGGRRRRRRRSARARPTTTARLQGPRDLRLGLLGDPGRGRQGRRRQGRHDRLARRHAEQQGGGRPDDRQAGLRRLPRATRPAHPAAVADRREVRRVHADAAARRRRGRAAAAARDPRRPAGRGPAPAAGRATPSARSTST